MKKRHFNFKRTDKEQRKIKERNELIQLMQWYIDDIYYSGKEIEKFIKYAEKDPIIKEKYKELYDKVIAKYKEEEEEIDRMLEEEELQDEEINKILNKKDKK
jgi:hypothetical protein